MAKVISKYPLDLTGRSPTNLVSGEKHLLLARGNTPYRVVSFSQGGFYTPSLKVYDKNFKLLIERVDYIATYKHVDASAYVGIEICSAVVILKPTITDYVLLGGQLVGSDFAFSLTVEDDTIAYLGTLGAGVLPLWAGFIGDEAQWQPGELQEELWSRPHYGNLNSAVERLTAATTSGNGVAEDIARTDIRTRYQQFMARFTGQVAAHINNHANPHVLDKADIGLEQVTNYPVADSPTARAGSSSAHYLTTRGVFDMVDQFGEIPMRAHLDARYNTHSPTASQLNTYTYAQFDARIDTKLPVGGTAVGANGIMGQPASNPGATVNFGQLPAYFEMRAGLNAYNFNSGRINPALLGIGTPNAGTVFIATGSWLSWHDLYIFLTAGGGSELYWGGYQGNNATALANIQSTFANEAWYPWGTVVLFMVNNLETYSYGNGGNDPHYFDSFRACIRTRTGWFVLG
ncbi:hypothetical protein D3C86_624090 [compost metagenome]